MTKKMKSLVNKITEYKRTADKFKKRDLVGTIYSFNYPDRIKTIRFRNSIEVCIENNNKEGFDISIKLKSMTKRKRKIVLSLV